VAGQPLQGPQVTGTYLQEAGVLHKEAGQPLQDPEVIGTETYLQRLECSARRLGNPSGLKGPEVA
jgi:hypothetical protein